MTSGKVKTGIDILERDGFNCFKNERVGLIVNPSSANSSLESTLSVFIKNKVKITALFGPEHGLRGEAQDQEECIGFMDEKCGAPIYSLYGRHLSPHRGMLKNVTTLVFDIQCIGSRFYTFKWTLFLVLQRAAQFEKKIIILDRPNPINGIEIEGPMLEHDYESFVGLFPIPIRHAMTIGELALLFSEEFSIGVDPDIVKMEGWQRELWFDKTGLPWIAPSPNMPTIDTATVYPGMCLIEGTNISEGRGTTKPFEYFGAPWFDCELILEELRELPGCKLRQICFKPQWGKYEGKVCAGFQLHITDRDVYKPVKSAIEIIRAIYRTHPEDFAWRQPPYEFEEEKLPFDILVGNHVIREIIEKGSSTDTIEKACNKGIEEFTGTKRKYELYK